MKIPTDLWAKRETFERDYWDVKDYDDGVFLDKWNLKSTEEADAIARFLEITER